MKQWQEKEFSQWVYYDDQDGKIIGSVYKVGNSNGIWGSIVFAEMEGILGQYIDSDYAKRAVEYYWEIQSRTLLEWTMIDAVAQELVSSMQTMSAGVAKSGMVRRCPL